MKTDLYTKAVMTLIALFLGAIVFDIKPSINAHAELAGSVEMIEYSDTHEFYHMKDGRVRECWHKGDEARCTPWLKWVTKQ